MNDRQERIIQIIRDTVDTRGFPPSLREIASQVDVSPQTVMIDLNTLEAEGRISREAGVPRGIRVL